MDQRFRCQGNCTATGGFREAISAGQLEDIADRQPVSSIMIHPTREAFGSADASMFICRHATS
jgi:hypothetical protein